MPQKSKLKLKPLDLGKESMGDRIARLRKERGLSQGELAEKMGLIQSLISTYEHNHRAMNAEMVARFAKVFGVTTDEIIGIGSNGKEKFVPNLKLMKRMIEIEHLSKYKQKVLLSMIDAYLKDNYSKHPV
jgi:transcriptional regulator with XRE-family HTH domain